MKKQKNYFVSLVVLLLIAVGCSTPEVEHNTSPSSVEIFGAAKDYIPTDLSNSGSTFQRSQPKLYYVKEFLFLRPNGANGLGHVGVGFEYIIKQNNSVIHRSWYWGSVENPQGFWSIASNTYNGGFASYATNQDVMFTDMKNRGYRQYKVRSERELNYNYVLNSYYTLVNFPSRGYNTFGNNCMNACWDVMWQLYTPNVAWVQNFWNFAPATWYNRNTTGWSRSNHYN